MSKLVFRGPKRPLGTPYCVALGGTETYGKFLATPYPALTEQKTGHRIVNLGCMNAGPDVYLNDPEVLGIAARADLTIVQVIGAANMSNRFYAVHPRRNDRFLRASPWLRTVYREVDFTDFHFTRHMLQTLHQVSSERFDVVAGELRTAWVARMRSLLRHLPGRTLLLWMADHAPQPGAADADLRLDPLLVNAGMIADVRHEASAYLEVVFSPEARTEGLENLSFAPLERPAAQGVQGTLAHREVADALATAIQQLLQ